MTSLAKSDWKHRRQAFVVEILNLCWIFLIYLLSELIIWGLSRILAPVRIEFFSSIISMILVFILMSMIHLCWRAIDRKYERYLKAKVGFASQPQE